MKYIGIVITFTFRRIYYGMRTLYEILHFKFTLLNIKGTVKISVIFLLNTIVTLKFF